MGGKGKTRYQGTGREGSETFVIVQPPGTTLAVGNKYSPEGRTAIYSVRN